MVHINPIYSKGFHANYPTHGQACNCLTIIQRCILIDMLQALIKAKAAVMNILKIVHVNQHNGEQFYQAPPGAAPAFPSLTKQTINSYSNSDKPTKSTEKKRGIGVLRVRQTPSLVQAC
jgi:hypothetical protein